MASQALLVLLLITPSYSQTTTSDAVTTATTTTPEPPTTPSNGSGNPAAAATEPAGTTPNLENMCIVTDVVDLQTAILCGDSEGIYVGNGNLTDAIKSELLSFLDFLLTQPLDMLADYSETYSLMNAILMAYSKLTNPIVIQSLEEESEIVTLAEEAFKSLAESLLPNSCSYGSYEGNTVNLCKTGSVRQFRGYTFTHRTPATYGHNMRVLSYFQETLRFDLTDLEDVPGEVTVVVLRQGQAGGELNEVDYHGRAYNDSGNLTFYDMNSAVLSTTLAVQGAVKSTPVVFSLYHEEPIINTKTRGAEMTTHYERDALCTFLDHEDTEDVHWSIYGCDIMWDETTDDYTTCTCNHTANFAVIKYTFTYQAPNPEILILTIASLIGCLLSIFFLMLLCLLFFYLLEILTFDLWFIYASLSIALIGAHVVFLVGIDKAWNLEFCTTMAIALHYCYLVVFAWSMVEGIHLYRKCTDVLGRKDAKMYLAIGWGLPAAMALVTFAANDKGYADGYSCWLNTRSIFIWTFLLPVILMVLINFGMLVLVFRKVALSRYAENRDRFEEVKVGARSAIVLLPVLLVTWTVGLLAANSPNERPELQTAFAGLNAFQALLIFLLNSFLNPEVRTAFIVKREKTKLMRARESLVNTTQFTYSTRLEGEESDTEDLSVVDVDDDASIVSGEEGSRPASQLSKTEETSRPASRVSRIEVKPLDDAGAPPSRPASRKSIADVTPAEDEPAPEADRPPSRVATDDATPSVDDNEAQPSRPASAESFDEFADVAGGSDSDSSMDSLGDVAEDEGGADGPGKRPASADSFDEFAEFGAGSDSDSSIDLDVTEGKGDVTGDNGDASGAAGGSRDSANTDDQSSSSKSSDDDDNSDDDDSGDDDSGDDDSGDDDSDDDDSDDDDSDDDDSDDDDSDDSDFDDTDSDEEDGIAKDQMELGQL